MSEKCILCGMPATRYCDAVIGVEAKGAIRNKAGGIDALISGLDGEIWTCDAPLCGDCATHAGHVSGSSPDSIDYCPHHAENGAGHLRDMVMFKDEAEKKRRALHAEIRRVSIRLAKR